MLRFSIVLYLLALQQSCLDAPLADSGSGKLETDNVELLQGSEIVVTAKTVETGVGIVAAEISADSKTTVAIAASSTGAVKGAELKIPPGALAISTEIVVQQGANIANSAVTVDLGIADAPKLTSASSALVISSSVAMDTSTPMQLSIPLSASGLGLQEENDPTLLIIVYKVTRASQNNKVVTGIIPNDQLTIVNGTVQFETTSFGSFQAAYAERKIEVEEVPTEVESETPILTKVEETALPTLIWSDFTASYATSTRTISASASLQGATTLSKCLAYIDQDKVSPWDQTKTFTDIATFSTTVNTDLGSDSYVRFTCEDEHGRVTSTPWSDAITIGALVASVSGAPSGTQEITSFTFSVSGTGVSSYSYAVVTDTSSSNAPTASSCTSATYTTVSSAQTSTTVQLANYGYHVLCVKAKDANGNTQSTATSALFETEIADTTAPVVSAGQDIYTNTATTVTATATDTSNVSYIWQQTVGQGSLFFSNSAASTSTVSADSEGIYTITVTATDSSGNAAQDSLEFTWDQTAPNAGTSTVTANATSTSSISLSWPAVTDNFTSATQIEYIVYYSTASNNVTVNGTAFGMYSNKTSETVTGLNGNTTYYFVVQFRDAAGNTGTFNVTSASTGSVGLAKVDGNQTTACGLDAGGNVYCWGYNGPKGMLGNGSTTDSATPVAIDTTGVTGSTTFTDIAVGESNACAVANDGEMYCWGDNTYYQLANGNNTDQTSPVQVNGGSIHFATVTIGIGYICGLDTTGAAYCWGNGAYGSLGQGDFYNASTPTAVVTSGMSIGQFFKISSGRGRICGVQINGYMYCWGGPTTMNAEPTTPTFIYAANVPLGRFVDVAVGTDFQCGIGDDGYVYCWGSDAYGALGDGVASQTDQSMPTAINTSAISGDKHFIAIEAYDNSPCGITGDGLAVCWGENTYGQNGYGDTGATQPLPRYVGVTNISGETTFRTMGGGARFNCGIAGDGLTYCWGHNGNGELGTGAAGANISAPSTTISTTNITPGSDWLFQETGFQHNCGLTPQGTIECLGTNTHGQVGDGTTTDASMPTTVVGTHVYKDVAAGNSHTCGLTTSGNIYCWGSDGSGQLGNGGTVTSDQSSPYPVDAALLNSGSHFIAIASDENGVCALGSDRYIYCWGTDTQLSSTYPSPLGGYYLTVSAVGGTPCGVTVQGALDCPMIP